MNKLFKTCIATAIIASSSVAMASNVYINLANNSYDTNRFIGSADADTATGQFTELGFSQLWATSIYDLNPDMSLAGTVTDTNITADLAAAGIPGGPYNSIDGSTSSSLVSPDCALGQCDIDALSPLVPPLGTDNEGFLQTWDIQVEYSLTANLTPAGPQYYTGYIEFFFNDLLNDANDRSIMLAEVTGSSIEAANLNIFFDIVSAELGFFFVEDDYGNFQDAGQLALDAVTSDDYAKLNLDTNVDPDGDTPVIPTASDLFVTSSGQAARQSGLDGSIAASLVPEPSMLALLGLSIIGFGVASRRRK
ncbi:PEP-CTERM sorting domain-containing protein [Glaciecola sp. 1036]|uniref:PEP-CTERM sorting domain-containing protein n=1 Tax=Alteromonadaceae TaxID=72275 RepID=UPI003D0692CF